MLISPVSGLLAQIGSIMSSEFCPAAPRISPVGLGHIRSVEVSEEDGLVGGYEPYEQYLTQVNVAEQQFSLKRRQ